MANFRSNLAQDLVSWPGQLPDPRPKQLLEIKDMLGWDQDLTVDPVSQMAKFGPKSGILPSKWPFLLEIWPNTHQNSPFL